MRGWQLTDCCRMGDAVHGASDAWQLARWRLLASAHLHTPLVTSALFDSHSPFGCFWLVLQLCSFARRSLSTYATIHRMRCGGDCRMWQLHVDVESVACLTMLARSLLSAAVSRAGAGRQQCTTSSTRSDLEQPYQLQLGIATHSIHSVVAPTDLHISPSRPLLSLILACG